MIASLGLEVGRSVDALANAATGQATQLQGFEDNIEGDAERVRKLWIVGQVVACLLILPTAALMWYYNNSLTTFVFGTPDTRFVVSRWSREFGLIYCGTLTAARRPVRFWLLLLLAKTYPLGAARVVSEQATGTYTRGGTFYISMSHIACFRLLSALLAACLLVGLAPTISYLRIADRGIGVADFPGTTEVLHPWTDVGSVAETHSFSSGSRYGGASPDHGYVIQFSDGSEWQSDRFFDDSSPSLQELDTKAAVTLAANRAKLPLQNCPLAGN